MVGTHEICEFCLIRASFLWGECAGAYEARGGGDRRIEIACNNQCVPGRHSPNCTGQRSENCSSVLLVGLHRLGRGPDMLIDSQHCCPGTVPIKASLQQASFLVFLPTNSYGRDFRRQKDHDTVCLSSRGTLRAA